MVQEYAADSTSTCACSSSLRRDISRLEAAFKSNVTDINFWLDEIVIRINTLNNKTGKEGHIKLGTPKLNLYRRRGGRL